MLIEYNDGCNFSLTIDGTETIDLDYTTIKNAIRKLLDKEEDLSVLQHMLIDLIESQGDYEDLGHCEQCGSYNYEYTIEI